MWRWSLISGGLIGLFWALWYLAAGEVSTVTGIGGMSWTTLFPLPRWLDILIGPIWACLVFTTVYLAGKDNYKRACKNIEMTVFGSTLPGLFLGGIVLCFTSVIVGFAPSFGLICGLIAAMILPLLTDLPSGLIFGVTLGAVLGLAFGIVFAVITILVALLTYAVAYLIKTFATSWKVRNWLTARKIV